MKPTALLVCLGAAGLGAVGLAGCSGLPSAGPTTSQVVGQAVRQGRARFDLVEIDPHVIATLAGTPAQSLRTSFDGAGKPPDPVIGIGDAVSVSIWQSADAGALGGPLTGGGGAAEAGAGAQSIVIPEQPVGADGAISVPFAGRVAASGRTPLQVQRAIERGLANHYVEPQVIVTVPKGVSNLVTVSGEVVNGARVSLSGRGERLLDVIAMAGGAKSPVYATFVRLSRGGETVSIPMDRLVADPGENIYVWPDDVITLVQAPRTFSVFGATLNNTQVPFTSDRTSLAQAIAKAGGLQDARADPAGVFLLRFEPPQVVAALGAAQLPAAPASEAPVVFHLSLQDVGGYFLASRFAVQDDDVIYVANASTDALQKFFTLVSTITGPVISGAVISRGTN